MKPFMIFVLVCLASGARLGSSAENTPDFDGLNDLVEEERGDLEFIKQNVDSLSGSIKDAAQMTINLADANGCDDNLLSQLNKIMDAGVLPHGIRRIETILAPHLVKTTNACISYLDKTVQTRVDAQFSDQVNAGVDFDTINYVASFYRGYASGFFSSDLMRELAWKLSKGDPRAKYNSEELELNHDQIQAAQDLDKYIIQPCQKYTTMYNGLFEILKYIPNLTDTVGFFQDRSPDFKAKTFTYIFCNSIRGNGEATSESQ